MSYVSYFALEKNRSLKESKRDAKIAAKELGYLTRFPDIWAKIDKANNETEISYILATAREKF